MDFDCDLADTFNYDCGTNEQCYECKENAYCNEIMYYKNRHYGQTMFLVLRILAKVSGWSLGLLGLYLWTSKKFKRHPYPIIAMACLFQGIYFTNYYSIVEVCMGERTKVWSTPFRLIGPLQDGSLTLAMIFDYKVWEAWFKTTPSYHMKSFYRLKLFRSCWKVIVLLSTYL